MNKTNILVIDDETGIREGCKRALTPLGFQVQTAENGEQGLQKISSTVFDLVLIDVMMPGTSGIDLISLIHQHDPEIICIIVTGYATVELAVAALKKGAYDFLTKPFTSDELLLVVNQGLERRQLSLETKRLQAIEADAQRLAAEKEKLEELDRAKVAFIRLVTHELQAPISAITTYLDLMLKGYIPPEQQHVYLERSLDRAKEQLALISDLLEFGKLREIAGAGKPGLVHLDVVLRVVIEQLEPQAKEKQILLKTDIGSNIAPTCIAADQVKSIWSNLISNAIKYTPSGGTVSVTLRQDDSNIYGQVRDTGIGIPDNARAKIFTEFYRASNAKDLNIPGTGLGLAIVKQIIEKAGGQISFESEIGAGTQFSFLLPITV
jgi:two-component system, sensor histidine kinase and response regulator